MIQSDCHGVFRIRTYEVARINCCDRIVNSLHQNRMDANVRKLVAFGSKEPFLYPPLIKNLKYEKLSFLHLCPNAINLLLGTAARAVAFLR